MRGHGPDANLHEPFDQPLFHNPREGAGVRVAISLEIFVDVRVGVDVEKAQVRVAPGIGAQDRVGDRVIPAEREDPAALPKLRFNGRFDLLKRLGGSACQGQIPAVEDVERVEVHPILAPAVGGFSPQGLPDEGRRFRRATMLGGLLVPRNSQQRDGCHMSPSPDPAMTLGGEIVSPPSQMSDRVSAKKSARGSGRSASPESEREAYRYLELPSRGHCRADHPKG